jgi:predicted DNA-binding protein
MSFRLINIRIPDEWYAQIKQFSDENNITLSEYIRGLIAANLEGMPSGMLSLGGFQEGYQQARALASKLAHGMLGEAQRLLPDSYEEALARYSTFRSPGRKPKDPND